MTARTPCPVAQSGRGLVALPAEAEAPWRRLSEALAGAPPACSTDPALWFPVDPEQAKLAVRICRHCPGRAPCAAFGEALDVRSGIWGGEDRGRQHRSAQNQHEVEPQNQHEVTNATADPDDLDHAASR